MYIRKNYCKSQKKIMVSPIKPDDYTFETLYCQLLNVKTYYIFFCKKIKYFRKK